MNFTVAPSKAGRFAVAGLNGLTWISSAIVVGITGYFLNEYPHDQHLIFEMCIVSHMSQDITPPATSNSSTSPPSSSVSGSPLSSSPSSAATSFTTHLSTLSSRTYGSLLSSSRPRTIMRASANSMRRLVDLAI
jgi:hypothetical protein